MGEEWSEEETSTQSDGYADTTAPPPEPPAAQSGNTTPKPLDRWLGIAGIVLGIVLFLVPKTPALVVLLLLLMFGLLIHPIWNFWWIERSILRRSTALVALFFGTILFGIWVWPPAPESPATRATSNVPVSPTSTGGTAVAAPQAQGTVRWLLESDFSKEVLSSKLPTLVFFCTRSDEACGVTSPAVGVIAQRFAGQVQVVGIDSYVNENIAGEYDARFFDGPVLSLFKGGVEQGRLRGAASADAISELITNPRKFKGDVPKHTEISASPRKESPQSSKSDEASRKPLETSGTATTSTTQSAQPTAKPEEREADKDPLAAIQTVAESDFDEALKESAVPVLAYFYKRYCDACNEVSPLVARINETRQGVVKVIKIDARIETRVAEKYKAGFFDVPVLVFFRSGVPGGVVRGTTSLATINRLIDHPEQFYSGELNGRKGEAGVAETLSGIPSVLDSDFESEVKAMTPTLAFFYDENDKTSKLMAPTVAEIAALYKDKVKVIRVDTSINRRTEYRYWGATLVLFQGGKVKGRIDGAFSKDAVSKMVDKLLTSK